MSQDYDQHIILHHLDDPLRILYWTLDEAMAVFVPTLASVFFNQLMIGLTVSILGFWSLRKLKKAYGFESIKHATYWYLPQNTSKLPHSPGSHIREYVG